MDGRSDIRRLLDHVGDPNLRYFEFDALVGARGGDAVRRGASLPVPAWPAPGEGRFASPAEAGALDVRSYGGASGWARMRRRFLDA